MLILKYDMWGLKGNVKKFFLFFFIWWKIIYYSSLYEYVYSIFGWKNDNDLFW